jgi:hypothetical protein
MPRFYNKVELQKTVKVIKRPPMTESERLLQQTCTECPVRLPVGVQQKHGSYARYMNQLRGYKTGTMLINGEY